MNARQWPVAVALLAIAVLGSYLLYTEQLVREFRSESETHQRMYALVQQGLLATEPDAWLQALADIQTELTELGVPIVAVNADGVPAAVANLPFEADLNTEAGRQRVLDYVATLDERRAPIEVAELGSIHFGSPPVIARLRWSATLQIAGAILLLLVGYVVVRSALRSERDRMWSAMARELAHQMGTPLTSLKGWHEMLRLPADERAELVTDARLAREVGADLDRLERVSRRFELIGKPSALAAVRPEDVLRELEHYLRPRLPRGVELRVRRVRGLPAIDANRVLLVWALENCVKNSLDALAGRGGWIRLGAFLHEDGIGFLVSDNGPGIDPAVRSRIFEPGVSTKAGGWGVGLSLTHRIVVDVHDGSIRVGERAGGGARFEATIPVAEGRRRSLERE